MHSNPTPMLPPRLPRAAGAEGLARGCLPPAGGAAHSRGVGALADGAGPCAACRRARPLCGQQRRQQQSRRRRPSSRTKWSSRGGTWRAAACPAGAARAAPSAARPSGQPRRGAGPAGGAAAVPVPGRRGAGRVCGGAAALPLRQHPPAWGDGEPQRCGGGLGADVCAQCGRGASAC